MVYATYGSGKAIIVGSFIGAAYHHFENPTNAKFLAGLAKWLDVSRPVDVHSSQADVFVEARILEGKDYKLLYGFNRGEKETKAKFAVPIKSQDCRILDLETGEIISFEFQDQQIIVKKALEPQEVWVVLLEWK
jgi:hypothetical protein